MKPDPKRLVVNRPHDGRCLRFSRGNFRVPVTRGQKTSRLERTTSSDIETEKADIYFLRACLLLESVVRNVVAEDRFSHM